MSIRTIQNLFLSISLLILVFSCSKPPTLNVQGLKTIQPNDKLEISWKAENAVSLEIEGVEDNLPTQGEKIFSPSEPTTYIFRAKNKGGKTVEQQFKVRVRKIPLEIEHFSVSKDSTDDKTTVNISWKVKGADSLRIEGLPKDKNFDFLKRSATTTKFSETTSLRLIASNRHGEEVDSIILIKIHKKEFFRAPKTTYKNEKNTLTWKIKDVESISIEGVGANFPPVGTTEVTLDETTTFILTGQKTDGTEAHFERTIKVLPPDIIQFGYKRKKIKGKSTVFISWQAGGVESVSIDKISDNLDKSGSIEVRPNETTIYQMSIFDGEQTITREITVPGIKEFWSGLGSTQEDNNFQLPAGVIYRGESIYLQWNIPEAKTVNIKGIDGTFKNRDSVQVEPVSSKTYELSFKESGRTKKLYHTVEVIRRDYIKNLVSVGETSGELYFDIIRYDRSDYPNSIKLHVMVTDEQGNFVSNLAPPFTDEETARSYFINLMERINGRETPIQSFEVIEINDLTSKPHSVALSLDYSGSMGNHVEAMEEAAKAMIQGKFSDDEMSITKYDDRIGLEVPARKDKSIILENANFRGREGMLQEYNGGTALYAGGDAALKTIEDSDNNKVVVLLTDGQENSSLAHVGTYAFQASQLVRNARNSGATIIPVAYGVGVNHQLLRDIAMLCDGQVYYVYNKKQARDIYTELPKLFHNYYEITYKPSPDDGEREIDLTYYNNIGDSLTTTGRTFIGDDFDFIDKYDFPTYAPANGAKKPISAPQALALFDQHSAVIKSEYHASLKHLAEYLNSEPKIDIEVWGHSDLHGNEESTYQISIKRAEAIKAFLVNEGVEEERIQTTGYGKTRPVWAVEEEDWQRHENRRIEVVLYQ